MPAPDQVRGFNIRHPWYAGTGLPVEPAMTLSVSADAVIAPLSHQQRNDYVKLNPDLASNNNLGALSVIDNSAALVHRP
jgi:hypothetical protein